jgi:uncharacterized phage-associated protein
MNIKKIITILGYLADSLGPITKLKVVKLFYYIDKNHLINYGRVITKDDYIHLPLGPIPTRILDIINDPEFYLDTESVRYLYQYLVIDLTSKFRTTTSIKKPDLDELSQSEIKTIDTVIEQYGRFTEGQLIDLTHKEKAYLKSASNDKLQIEDIIDGIAEQKKKELLSLYYEDSKTDQALHCMVA